MDGSTLSIRKEDSGVPDRLRATEPAPIGELNKGEGKILRLDGECYAMRRTDAGELVNLSTLCRHLGCVAD